MTTTTQRADLDAALDAAAVGSSTPGAQAALLWDGRLLWTGSYGVAHVEAGSVVTDDTVFCLASLGKTMLATLALRLVEEGRLGLDAPISTILADEVPGTRSVTVRMLLDHTSGYPDLYETPEVRALMPPQQDGGGEAYDPDRPFTWEMVAQGLREPLEPGVRWEYSNTGYIVLTEVLMRVLGGAEGIHGAWTSLAGDVRGTTPLTEDILTMQRSSVGLARMARGMEQQPDGTFVDPYAGSRPSGIPTDLFGLPFGDGLFAGTATGAAVFLDSLFVDRTLLTSATLDQMTTATPQAAAADHDVADLTSYGLGTFRTTAGATEWQGHSGSYAGFSTFGASSLARRTTLVVLTNGLTPDRPARAIWGALADASR
jgi:D-alanyl-D-alanine carboxypeptidase